MQQFMLQMWDTITYIYLWNICQMDFPYHLNILEDYILTYQIPKSSFLPMPRDPTIIL